MVAKKLNLDDLVKSNKAVDKKSLVKGLSTYRELKRQGVIQDRGYRLENPYDKRAYKKVDDNLASKTMTTHPRR